jgi:hypothetical protein
MPSDLLKNGRVVPNWRLGVAASLASDFRFNGFLFSDGHIFRQLKCRTELPELPGSVAGVYKWLLTIDARQMAVLVLFGVFCG